MRSQLPEMKIAPEHGNSALGDTLRQCHKKWRLTIRPSPVRDHQAIARRISRDVKVSSNRRFVMAIRERPNFRLAHAYECPLSF